jgi:hypothetical protein
MDRVSRAGTWLNRIVLIFVTILFAFIGFRNLMYPAEATAAANITLNSPTAFSVARVSMGAFPVGFAIIVFSSIFSGKQIFTGIFSVFIVAAITTIVRVMSLIMDGHSDFGQRVLLPEILITILSGIGVSLELRRRKLQGRGKGSM